MSFRMVAQLLNCSIYTRMFRFGLSRAMSMSGRISCILPISTSTSCPLSLPPMISVLKIDLAAQGDVMNWKSPSNNSTTDARSAELPAKSRLSKDMGKYQANSSSFG